MSLEQNDSVSKGICLAYRVVSSFRYAAEFFPGVV